MAVVALYAAITAWWLWPLPSVWTNHSGYFGAEIPVVVSDYHFLVWTLSWGTHALLNQPLHLFDANAFHPVTGTLALSDHLLGYQPIFAPLYGWTGNPVLAANLTLFATYPLSGLAAYAFARRWVGRPAALVAGAVFAFYPYRLRISGHFHQLGVQYLPLVLLFCDRWLERARRRDAALLAGSFALQALSSFYIAYTTVLALGTYLVVALVRWRRSLDRRRIAGLVVALLVGALPVVATGIPYLRFRDLGVIPSYDVSDAPFAIGSVPALAAIAATRYMREEGPAILGYALALLALLPPWRGRSWPLALAVLLAIFGVVLCFGSTITIAGHELWSPYRVLVVLVPGLSSVRLPIRFNVIAQMGFALLAALGIERIARRVPTIAWPLATVAILGSLRAYASLPAVPLHAEIAPPDVPPLQGWLAKHGDGRPLLEIPPSSFASAAHRMYMSTYHWLPIVDGYSSYWPPSAIRVHWSARDLPSEAGLQELVDEVDLGWILVNVESLSSERASRWHGPYPDGLDLADAPVAPGQLLFRVTRPMRANHRDRITSTTTSLGGIPLRPIEGSCGGEVRLVAGPPNPWRPLSNTTLQVEVSNRSASPWPADGIFPALLVQGRASLQDANGRSYPNVEFRLSGDVSPGETAKGSFVLRSPLTPGDYEVAVWLVQGRSGSLERCGLAPLRVPVRVGDEAVGPHTASSGAPSPPASSH